MGSNPTLSANRFGAVRGPGPSQAWLSSDSTLVPGDGPVVLRSQASVASAAAASRSREGKGGRREWETSQRYGENVIPTYLYFDVDKGVVSSDQVDNKLVPEITPEITDVTEGKDKKKEILEYLGDNILSEKKMRTGVSGDTGLISKSLRELVREGEVLRAGRGVRGDPYQYSGKL